jgi:hypothetical protein
MILEGRDEAKIANMHVDRALLVVLENMHVKNSQTRPLCEYFDNVSDLLQYIAISA